jgi:N12 class adenine-specific DNA methylase
LSGVELDSITGRIAQQLYQNADVQVKGFEKTDFSDNFFDAAVGNVPFGSYPVSDKRYNRENFFIHDYFLAKTLDKLAPCGVAALITTKGTLDKENPKVREYLAKRADLIGAIRLPNTAFKANAGTEVTTDILFLQKREKMAVEMPDWCYIAQDNNGVPVNQYFLDHPEMVLGTMKQGLEFSLYGNPNETACVPIEGADLKQQLEAAVANLKTNNAIRKHSEQRKAEAGVIAATEDVRNFTFAEVDGKMYFRENNIMTEAADKNGNALTGKSLDRIRALNELRQTFRTILTAQENNCSDAQLETYQKILNAQYDALVKKYGYINDRANYQAFSKDDDYNSLCALEIINEETHEVTKSAFFSKRTVKHVTEITHVDTPQEALFVSVDTLGKLDIPYMAKLCGKEPDEVIDALKADNLIYLNPKKANPEKPYEGWEEASEYLSGNVRVKLRAAERAAEGNPDLQRNVDALKAVIPQKLEAGDITARIGVHWVDVEDYQKFLQEYAKAHFTYGEPLRRAYNGEYKIPFKGRDYSKAATEIFGTKRMNSLEIFENLLNNRDVVVKDKKIDPDGKEHYEINKKETELAQDKASKMKEAFKRWLWEEPERREKYVTRYNELFNCIVGRKYDGSHQTFPGMSPSISLKPHQLDAVARAKFGGNTLLAHCVGAGKSFEMVAATMEKKRLGLINKACVVVPKALVGQMASEWLRLYPQAKILTATEKDFDKDHRQKFIGRCCTGDYDAVVMSYEQFEKIPMSFEYRRDFIQREINTLTSGIDDLKSNGGRNENSGSIKDMERVKKRLEARLEKLIEDNGKTKDTSLNFEQLGFDSIVVDEAHNYKNGLVVTKMQRVAGVQTTPAQKSEDILMKTQYLNENYGERNLLFATGTPVSNSMSELYIMQRYLRPSLLAQAGLQTFDDWASTFGEVVSKAEMKPAGNGYRTKKRFAKFNNLPELMAMYKEFADMRTADMLNLPVPKIKGGKPETIVAEPNDFQKAYMKVLAERSEQVHSGAVDATKDNMLKITGEARLLGLDVRCLNPEAPNYPDSKVNLLVQKVMEIYTQTTPQKGVQAIFCDIAVHGDNETEELSEGNEQKSKKPKAEKSEDGKFSVYNYIKAELIRRGIPADEICFAGDADTVKKQNEMKAQLRSGTKRIVLSSTSKLGTGANIQNKLVALHNLDIPWKPSDLEQRLGRIVRQGNENEEVGIYNYVTKDTFDAYMMNIIVTKQKFISQLNTTTSRSCEDVDDLVLNYSEIQAMAVGDERIKEKIELDMDVSRLKMLESEHYNEQYRLDDTIADAQKLMKNLTRNIEAAKNDLAFAQENRYLPENFKVEIGGKVYTDRKEAGTAIREAAVEFMANDNGAVRQPIGTFCGFELSVGKNHGSFGGATAEIVIRHGISYATDMDLTGDIGNTTRLENLFGGGIEKKIADLEERAERTNADLQAALANKGKPFEHAEELAQKSARLEQLNLELEVGKVDEVIIADDEPEQGEPDRNEKRHGKDAPDNDRDKPTPPKRGHR